MPQGSAAQTVQRYTVALAELLDGRFNLAEIKDLCFDLSVDYDNIAGATKREKAQELTKYFARRKVLDQLVAAIRGARPDIIIEAPPAEAARPRETHVYVACISARPVAGVPETLLRLPPVAALVSPGRQREGGGAGAEPARPQPTDVLLHAATESELVLASFGDAATLLLRVIQIAAEAQARGGPALRVGIHGALAPDDRAEGDDSTPAVPNEFVNLARRVASLGRDGHVLATAHAVETLRRDDALRRFIHQPRKCEVKYHVRVEIFNIYDPAEGKFGNPAQPHATAPTEVLTDVKFPEELKCARPGQVVLTFSPALDYARVVFGFRQGSDLQVSCEGKGDEDCSFDYYPSDGNRVKVFDIWAVKSSEETLEPVSIRCFDGADELMAPPVRGRVLLRRRVQEPSGVGDVFKIPVWVLDRLSCQPLWKIVLIVLAAVAGVLGLAAYRYDWDRYEQDKERWLVRARIWPPRHKGAWPETFKDTPDHRPSGDKWAAVPPDWKLVDQTGKDPTDKSLYVRGEQVGFNKIEGGASLYNFKASLRFKLRPGQRVVSWVLRACDAGDYYLFVLTLPPANEVKATIQGFAYEGGEKAGQLTADNEVLSYNQPFPAGSTIFLEIEATENTFKHTFTSSVAEAAVLAEAGVAAVEDLDPEKEDEIRGKYFVGEDLKVMFTDPKKRHRWGGVGFRGLGPDDEMEVEEINVTNAS